MLGAVQSFTMPARLIAEDGDRWSHSQIATTMNLYSHVVPSLQREAAAQLDTLLSKARGT